MLATILKRMGAYVLAGVVAVGVLFANVIWTHNALGVHRRVQDAHLGTEFGNMHRDMIAAMKQVGVRGLAENPSMLDNYPSGLTLNYVVYSTGLLSEEIQWSAQVANDNFLISNSVILLVMLILLYEIRQLAKRLPPSAG